MAALDKERQAVSQLRHLDSAKNEFVSTVSHELRTPITSIVGYVEMIQDGAAGEVDEDMDRLLGAVHRNGRRLMGLADDLLTLSEFEAGTFHMAHHPIDLREVMRHVEEATSGLTSSRDLRVVFSSPPEPMTVRGDAGHLERALLNLLSNAVKFTEDGGEVSGHLRRERDQAVIEIADSGLGIPEDEQARLFTRFFRSSTAQHRAIQGTGLGLSIVDSVVRAHGGTIEVSSAHLQGTRFTITLPLADGARRRQHRRRRHRQP